MQVTRKGRSVRAVIVVGTRCLVIQRRPDAKHWPGQWEWPGGKVEAGDQGAIVSLKREVREETGLEIDVLGALGAFKFEVNGLEIEAECFLAAPTGGALRICHEHVDFQWCPISALTSLDFLSPAMSFATHWASTYEAHSLVREFESPQRSEIERWAELPVREWVAAQIERFRRRRPGYGVLGREIERTVLQSVRTSIPSSIVNTRVKDVGSLAEKLARKYEQYRKPTRAGATDPLERVTDLCGCRIIVETKSQVAAVCRFIERVFVVDRDNSEDTSKRLNPREFGYRSVHYIVSLARPLAGVSTAARVPDWVYSLKAEIQVRTLLEHAVAQLNHDTTYKTELAIPGDVERDFASIAAVLEATDHDIGRLLSRLEQYRSNFGAFLETHRAEAEIERLRIVMRSGEGSEEAACRAARLFLSIGRFREAADVLRPYEMAGGESAARLQGQSLVEVAREGGAIDRETMKRAVTGLLGQVKRDPEDAISHAWLAEALSALGRDEEAAEVLAKAGSIDADDPMVLRATIENRFRRGGSWHQLEWTAPQLRSSVRRCRNQIEGKVNLPVAWSSLSLFHLFLGEYHDGLCALARLISHCRPAAKPTDPLCAFGSALRQLVRSIRLLASRMGVPEEMRWFERLALLGTAVKHGDRDAVEALAAAREKDEPKPVAVLAGVDRCLILSGGCQEAIQACMDGLRQPLIEAVDDAELTVVCGATDAGIGGIALGLLAAAYPRVRLIGYQPRRLDPQMPFATLKNDPPRIFVVRSQGSEFTPGLCLDYWTDFVLNGVPPSKLKLMSYCGKRVAQVEIAVAAALGASTAVIQSGQVPLDRRFDFSLWEGVPNLHAIPLDRMTLRAFILIDDLSVDLDSPALKPYETAARNRHESHRAGAIPSDPSLMPWGPMLDEDFKRSCFHQVLYAERILRTAGYVVRPLEPDAGPLVDLLQELDIGGIERLAEMEHGRWNVERFKQGWSFAKTKDVKRKTHPCLVSWAELPPEIRKYDIDAIVELPLRLREAGLEVRRATT